MAFAEDFSTVQVLYQLSWDHGRLEHPHMIEVQYPSNQDGLRLRDVKKRLTTLRGHGIGQSFSWSYKRNYRNTFIWNDLCDDDVIHPLRGSGEYLMKASERLDTFASKAAEPLQDFRTKSVENHVVMKDAGADCVATENESFKKLPTLSVEQETIDVEKSDFCLSSSDNEVSPRPRLADCCDTKPVKAGRALVASPTVLQGLQTPTRLTSPTELPLSPGSAKRMWKREIRKSLFRTSSRNITTTEIAVPAAGIDVELPEDALLRSKSCVAPANLHESKEAGTPRRELIKSLWARWTGASGKGKPISSPPQTKQHARSPRHIEPSHQSSTKRIDDSVSMPEETPAHVTQTAIIPEPPASVANPRSSALDGDSIERAATPFPQPKESKMEIKVALSVEIPNLEVDVPDSPTTSDIQGGGPPEAEIDTPNPAIARAKGLSRVRTTAAAKPLPPGFHKGTNDTKPVQTPRRNSSAPLASPPPLLRSLSRDAKRSLSARRRASITPASPKDDSVTSPENRPVKKYINFRERDERPLQPGLSSLDWEKALQEAAANCLPPPNFGDILQECSNCGRTFKPDSLQVHKRGCHPPQYSRAFSARASPMKVRSRAA